MTLSARLWPLLALLVLAIVSWNILDISTTKQDRRAPSENQLDFYAHGINTLQTDIEGKAKNRLIAKTMLHFEKDDHTELEQPVATLYQPDSPPWVIKSEQGLVSAEGKEITLQKNVSIQRDHSKTNQPVLITTDSLLLEPDNDYAETADPIRFTSGQNVINSIGMKGHIKKPMKIELLSNVRGEYEAP